MSQLSHPLIKTILDDLSCRFIVNCPPEEFSDFNRVCFQLELAYWFYEDEYSDKDHTLPKFQFRQFVTSLFQNCPILRQFSKDVDNIVENWKSYKNKVTLCGAILLNPKMDKCLLVRGYNSKIWGFPKGKINQDESEIDCSIREVREEIGFNIKPFVKEENSIEVFVQEQKLKMYIVPNVPETIHFVTQTKKEISEIAWKLLSELPKSTTEAKKMKMDSNTYVSTFGVTQVLRKLNTWVNSHQKTKKMQLAASQGSVIQAKVLRSTIDNDLIEFSPLSSPVKPRKPVMENGQAKQFQNGQRQSAAGQQARQHEPTLLQILFQQTAPHSAAQQAQQAEALSDYSWLQQQHYQQQQQRQVNQPHVPVELHESREERQRQTTIVLQHLFDSSRSLQQSTENEEEQQQPQARHQNVQRRTEVSVEQVAVMVNVKQEVVVTQPVERDSALLFCDPQHPFTNFKLDFSRFKNTRY